MTLERICWFAILIAIEALALCSVTAFALTVLLWAGALGGSI